MLNDDIYWSKPRKIDDESLARTVVNSYDTEIMRRRRTVDDEFRNDLEKYREAGRFMYGDLSVHDLWQKIYLDKFGEFIPMDRGYMCSHCGTRFLMPYPPEYCTVCHHQTPFGRMVEEGYGWRK